MLVDGSLDFNNLDSDLFLCFDIDAKLDSIRNYVSISYSSTYLAYLPSPIVLYTIYLPSKMDLLFFLLVRISLKRFASYSWSSLVFI
jgi:hypothetical protein